MAILVHVKDDGHTFDNLFVFYVSDIIKLVLKTNVSIEKKGGYGVNIHDTKISYVQVNTKQRNSA